MVGGTEREIRVNVDRDKLQAHGLSITQVTQAISGANLNFPTGKIENEESQILVRLSGKFQNVNDIANLAVGAQTGGSITKIKDVAEVYDTEKEATTISRINGQNSIGLSISKQSDGNSVEVAENVKKKIAELQDQYAESGLNITIAQDSSEFTLEAANHVIMDLGLAVVLVALIMLFFLHSFRDALIVMVSIPISIIATFIAMNLLGFSLNLMTLMGLSLVVGILVDDSIVVIENIHARMEKGTSAREAAMGTWKNIGMSVLSITLTLVAVFVPITFTTGIIADLLRQFALVVAFATMISFVVSFTLTPWLASRFSRSMELDSKKFFYRPLIWFEKGITAIRNAYKSMLDWSLAHKRVTVAGIFAVVIASFFLVGGGFIGSEFVKSGDTGELLVQIELPKESTLKETNAIVQQAERKLLNDPLVADIFTTVGSSSGAMSTSTTPYVAEINAKMISLDERDISAPDYAIQIKKEMTEEIAGAKFKAAAASMVGGANTAPVAVILRGDNLDTLLAFADKALAAMDEVAGTHEEEISVEGGTPEIEVNVDREKMAQLNLSMSAVGGTMQNAFAGNTSNKFRDGENEYDINVRLDEFDRTNVDDIKQLTFMNDKGELIELQQFASIGFSSGQSVLERNEKQTSVTISSMVSGRPEGTVGVEVQEAIKALDFPEGVEIESGGSLESQNEAFASLGVALLMSIVLVYLIMVALYNSYVYPFVVMFSVPVALIGAFLALALAMENLSIFTILGILMLVGLVIKNAILIVDFANQEKERGQNQLPSRGGRWAGTFPPHFDDHHCDGDCDDSHRRGRRRRLRMEKRTGLGAHRRADEFAGFHNCISPRDVLGSG